MAQTAHVPIANVFSVDGKRCGFDYLTPAFCGGGPSRQWRQTALYSAIERRRRSFSFVLRGVERT